MANAKFEFKLIPEVDGSTSVVDWIESVELTYRLCSVKQVKLVIPLCLTGGGLDVYQQLSLNERIGVGLFKAFAMDPCTAYKCFSTQILMAGETVDVFFVTLKMLVVLFGALPEQTFFLYICCWTHSSGETTIVGVHKH